MFWVAASLICGFALELFLCFRLSRTITKLSPVFVVLAGMLVIALLFTSGSFTGTYGGFSGDTLLVAFFFWGVMLVVAILAAWPVYWLVAYFRNRKYQEENDD